MKVAIQGFRGSYHEIATYKYFGERQNLNLIECDSFVEFFKQLERNNDGYGIMAIENTVAGTLLPNYMHLLGSKMQIVGEVYLRIEHFLLTLPQNELSNISEVHSHPMALLQCLEFFKPYPNIRLVETTDTALSAQKLKSGEANNIAVIASQLAAEMYGLKTLERGIETNSRNFTRFLVLHAATDENENNGENFNKASLNFHLKHEIGSLANVLAKLSKHNVNLTKIQSVPVIGQEWEYSFIVDVVFDEISQFNKAIDDIKIHLSNLRLLGKYVSGRKYRRV